MMISKIAISLLASVAVFSLMMGFLTYKKHTSQNLRQRIEYFSDYVPTTQSRRITTSLRQRLIALFRQAGKVTNDLYKNNFFNLKMQQADWPMMGSEFQLLLLLLGIASGVIFFFFSLKPVVALIGFFWGIILGWAILQMRIQRRRNAFTNQLSDMLKMVSDALRSGYSFMQALEYVAGEMSPPVSREIQLVLREVNLNVSLEIALDHMCQRIHNKDFELVVTAVLIHRQIGGNLSQILDTISTTVNDRIKMRREINALTAQGKLSGIILAILPIALGAVISVVNPDYLAPLFENELGHLAIAFAIIMEIIGFIVIRRIIDIDV